MIAFFTLLYRSRESLDLPLAHLPPLEVRVLAETRAETFAIFSYAKNMKIMTTSG